MARSGNIVSLAARQPTYPLWSQQSHADNHPSTLASSQDKRLLDPQCVHDLQCHDGRIPVCEVLGGTTGCPMAQRLDSEQVYRVRELRVAELITIERYRGAHRVDEDTCRLGGIVAIA